MIIHGQELPCTTGGTQWTYRQLIEVSRGPTDRGYEGERGGVPVRVLSYGQTPKTNSPYSWPVGQAAMAHPPALSQGGREGAVPPGAATHRVTPRLSEFDQSPRRPPEARGEPDNHGNHNYEGERGGVPMLYQRRAKAGDMIVCIV